MHSSSGSSSLFKGDTSPEALYMYLQSDWLCNYPGIGANCPQTSGRSPNSELPIYMAAAEDVSSSVDVTSWWKSRLPHWAQAFRLVALVQPSSAAAERVFSILSYSFSAKQHLALEDYVQLSVMLQ